MRQGPVMSEQAQDTVEAATVGVIVEDKAWSEQKF